MVNELWSKQIDSILCTGRSLSALGVRNWALDRLGALSALDEFCVLGVAVAGGDVYKLKGEILELTYDNWYCDRSINEDILEYVDRSIAAARRYILEYPASETEYFFALVPSLL